MNINEVKTQLKDKKEKFFIRVAKQNLLKETITKDNKSLQDALESLSTGQEALQLLEDIANSRRGQVKDKLEGIISEALKLIYGKNYSIELVYDVKNNRSHLDFQLVKETSKGTVKRNMSGFGGGVADIISVPLRLLVLLGSKQTDKVCILDECYKHVDLDRIELVAKFIKDISKKLGIQIIMSSHHEAMREEADTVYQITSEDGKAKARKVL